MNIYIKNIKDKTPIGSQKYFSNLISRKMPLEVFQQTQLNFFDAVLFFSKPMFIISSKLDSYQERIVLLENILDEHGNGDISKAHGKTFEHYLLSIGVSQVRINDHISSTASKYFNNYLLKAAEEETTHFSIAMMGIIEDRYVEITKILIDAFSSNKWFKGKSFTHYNTHKKLDVNHSESFYNLIKHHWYDKTHKIEIKRGLDFGNKLILKLYSDLL